MMTCTNLKSKTCHWLDEEKATEISQCRKVNVSIENRKHIKGKMRCLTKFKMSGALDSFIVSVAFFMRACSFIQFQLRGVKAIAANNINNKI